MLDYKDIITKHYALRMSGREIAAALGVSKSGVNGFLSAFDKCDTLHYPLPPGITNYGIAELVYRRGLPVETRDLSFELPDYAEVEKQLSSRKNMTLVFLWGRYKTGVQPKTRSSTPIDSSVSSSDDGARRMRNRCIGTRSSVKR